MPFYQCRMIGAASSNSMRKGTPFQASAYEKQWRATIARVVTKFTGYRRVGSRTPPTK